MGELSRIRRELAHTVEDFREFVTSGNFAETRGFFRRFFRIVENVRDFGPRLREFVANSRELARIRVYPWENSREFVANSRRIYENLRRLWRHRAKSA